MIVYLVATCVGPSGLADSWRDVFNVADHGPANLVKANVWQRQDMAASG